MDDGIKIITNMLGRARLKSDEPLKYHLNPDSELIASNFYIATSQKELIEILNICNDLKIPFNVLGSGQSLKTENKILAGITIKNRANAIKLSGIKGKIGVNGLGIESALLEVDSGVSVQKLNDYLHSQNLAVLDVVDSFETTIGDSINSNSSLKNMVETIKIWEHGMLDEVSIIDYKNEIVVAVILRVRAK